MRHFLFIAALVLFASPAAHAGDLTGFDGLPWETPVESVQGESREMLGGEVMAKRSRLEKFEASINAHTVYKVYYFCADTGLCGGNLFIAHKKRLSNPKATIDHLKALLGDAHGYLGETGRGADTSWIFPSGRIFISTSFDDGHPIVEVKYQGNEYMRAKSRHEAAMVARSKDAIESWGFKF